MQHQVLTRTIPSQTYGLIDISGDATEVGLVADGVLQTVVSNTWGHYAVAREIALITQEPLAGAFARLQETAGDTLAELPEQQRAQLESTRSRFSEELSVLIARAAQQAEVPTHYIIHCDTGLRDFALQTTTRALSQLTNNPSSVTVVNEKLLDIATIPETRLALSVAVFHTPKA